MIPENKKIDVAQKLPSDFSNADEERADDQMTREERRSVVRMRQYKGGRLVFNEGYGSYDCLIRNISTDGAKLQFEGHSALPELVQLLVPGDGVTYNSQVIWRTSREIGVRFLSGPEKVAEKQDLKKIFSD